WGCSGGPHSPHPSDLAGSPSDTAAQPSSTTTDVWEPMRFLHASAADQIVYGHQNHDMYGLLVSAGPDLDADGKPDAFAAAYSADRPGNEYLGYVEAIGAGPRFLSEGDVIGEPVALGEQVALGRALAGRRESLAIGCGDSLFLLGSEPWTGSTLDDLTVG